VASEIPRPKVILFISAHWLTRGTWVTAMKKPKTIHDFGGFPAELFSVEYPASGDPLLAEDIASHVAITNIGIDLEWGLDHGAWSVAKPMYPGAEIPAVQLSIDYYKPSTYHYELSKELNYLRKKGVLIIGSGNMVHNLRQVDFYHQDKGFDWAMEMNEIFKQKILDNNHGALINYPALGSISRLAIPTPDHYFPLIYSLGLQEKNEPVKIFNDKPAFGSITMTSVKIGN
jgi:4,5-DOPA dioxygenase extradiol